MAVGILSLVLRTVISRGRDECGTVEKTLKGILTIGTVLVFPMVVALSLSLPELFPHSWFDSGYTSSCVSSRFFGEIARLSHVKVDLGSLG